MPKKPAQYSISGQVGEHATVLMGKFLNNITVQPSDAAVAIEVLRFLQDQWSGMQRPGLPRRLQPLVLTDRWEQLETVQHFFEDTYKSVLYIFGIPGIGKSSLVRFALEQARPDVPVARINCEDLEFEHFLMQLNTAFTLEKYPLIRDEGTPDQAKIENVLGAVQKNSIVVLRRMETLLDAKGCYKSRGMADVMSALTTLEHKVKAVVTTQRLPKDVGAKTPGIQILRLNGLSNQRTKTYFMELTGLTQEKIIETSLDKALEKLEGHPLFIEMVAKTVDEIPAEKVAAGLLKTTDIGEYITEQLLSTVGKDEIAILRTARVFRDDFHYNALNFIYNSMSNNGGNFDLSIKALIQHALLEVVSNSMTPKYHLHRLLREAVPCEAKGEAKAHSLAANWFMQGPIDVQDPVTWDDGLYHLRRAAEVGRENVYIETYLDFLSKNNTNLSFAGWGRRIVNEFKVLYSLVDNPLDRFVVGLLLGNGLSILKEYPEATDTLREVNKCLDDYQERHTKMGTDSAKLAQITLKVKMELAEALINQGEYDEAQQLADQVEPISSTIDDLEAKLGYQEVRFQIARKSKRDPEVMLPLAIDYMKSAEKWLKESPSQKAQDYVAEAHFALGITYLYLNDPYKCLEHHANHLKIKLQIGKLSGIGAGLLNLSIIFHGNASISSAMFLTSEQISFEIGQASVVGNAKVDETVIKQFLDNPEAIDEGREALNKISKNLLPYFERALERRRGE